MRQSNLSKRNKGAHTVVVRLMLIIGSFCGLCAASTIAYAAGLDQSTLLKTRPSRDVIWGFESGLLQYNLRMPDNSKIAGLAGCLTVGYGQIQDNQWLTGRFHFLAGPFDLARQGQFDADFSGTKIDVEYGSVFPGQNFRGGSAPILSISAGYMDLGGHNIGDNRKNNGNANDSRNFYLEQEFRVHVGSLVVSPAIGWAWTKSPRPQGNEPELLLTRVESAFVRLGATVPLYSRARSEVIKRDEGDSLWQTASKHTTTGQVSGYSLVASGGVWLGI
jgi:hypothetical protein